MYCDNGKVQYADSKAAHTAAQLGRTHKKQKFSFYRCSICGLFHTNTVKNKKMGIPKKADKYPDKYIQNIKNQKLHPIPKQEIKPDVIKVKKQKKRGRKNRRNS